MILGKPGPNMRRYCGCKVGTKRTKRGTRRVVTHPDTKMVRFISEADFKELAGLDDICAYLPEPFRKGK